MYSNNQHPLDVNQATPQNNCVADLLLWLAMFVLAFHICKSEIKKVLVLN